MVEVKAWIRDGTTRMFCNKFKVETMFIFIYTCLIKVFLER
jgi:hypothetical protein